MSELGQSPLREQAERHGWHCLSWGSDRHDSVEYAFRRAGPNGTHYVLSALVTPASDDLVHILIERWTYTSSGTTRATVRDQFIPSPVTQDDIDAAVQAGLEKWQEGADRTTEMAEDASEESEMSLEEDREAEEEARLQSLFVEATGQRQQLSVRLESLGAELLHESRHVAVRGPGGTRRDNAVSDEAAVARGAAEGSPNWRAHLQEAPLMSLLGASLVLIAGLQVGIAHQVLQGIFNMATTLLAATVYGVVTTVIAGYVGSRWAEGRRSDRYAVMLALVVLEVFLIQQMVSREARFEGLATTLLSVGAASAAFLFTWLFALNRRESGSAGQAAWQSDLDLIAEYAQRANVARALARATFIESVQRSYADVAGRVELSRLMDSVSDVPAPSWLEQAEVALEAHRDDGGQPARRGARPPRTLVRAAKVNRH